MLHLLLEFAYFFSMPIIILHMFLNKLYPQSIGVLIFFEKVIVEIIAFYLILITTIHFFDVFKHNQYYVSLGGCIVYYISNCSFPTCARNSMSCFFNPSLIIQIKNKFFCIRRYYNNVSKFKSFSMAICCCLRRIRN